ncbi:MAG: HD domain-containing phosphohydrolase, partial [Gaiellaceae bacterium]
MAAPVDGRVEARSRAGDFWLLRAWQLLLVAGLLVLAAHDFAGVGWPGSRTLIESWLYDFVEAVAAAGCVARAVVVRTERVAWLAIAIGLLLSTVGDFVYDFAYGANPPYPSFADAFYLGFYPALYVGLVLLVRRRVSGFNSSLWLDGLMAATAAGALGGSVLLEVVVTSTHGSRLVVLTNLSYPLGDIVLLALVVFVFAVVGRHPGRAWAMIGAGLLLNTVGDAVFLYQSSTNSYVEGTFVDVLWPTSLVLIALSAWQSPAGRRRGGLEQRALFATPIVCGLIGVGVLVDATVQHVHPLAVALAVAAIALVLVRAGLTLRENAALLERSQRESVTDALTGLGNRRKLVVDLERYLASATPDEPHLLAIFDLNGFKDYNDTFGHPAGDAMLARLAGKLADAVAPAGCAYRLGGDEFCALLPASETLLDRAARALHEPGESFDVSSAFGAVTLPVEARDQSAALRLADERLYAHKQQSGGGRGGPHEVLMRALAEREPDLRTHVAGVALLAAAVGRLLGLGSQSLEELRLAAELHDVGKLAIPDTVLKKREPLDDEDWQFIRRHTVIGERILAGAPALRSIGEIVRSTHERWDGGGYPDALKADQIPLAARIIAVCDAYSAMISDRPYRPTLTPQQALAELEACAGTQFDPQIVQTLHHHVL